MDLKFKPVFNFQSVEFEMEVNTDEELDTAFEMYKKILDHLQKIAVDQPGPVKQAPVKKEPMATPNQIKCLVNLGVVESEAKAYTMTMASRKINELLNK